MFFGSYKEVKIELDLLLLPMMVIVEELGVHLQFDKMIVNGTELMAKITAVRHRIIERFGATDTRCVAYINKLDEAECVIENFVNSLNDLEVRDRVLVFYLLYSKKSVTEVASLIENTLGIKVSRQMVDRWKLSACKSLWSKMYFQ